MNDVSNSSAPRLRTRWQELLAASPDLRIRDAARTLGVSEARLLATGCGAHVFRLRSDWKVLLGELQTLGEVMALTRNDSVVHEKTGLYAPVSFEAGYGLVTGEDIDLRLFLTHWRDAFAVMETLPNGRTRRSIQFFDAYGDAVHKVHTTPNSDLTAFDAYLARHQSDDQSPDVAPEQTPRRVVEKADTEIDVAGFQAGWHALRDTHDFFPLLRQFGVTRTQALRLAPEGCARQVSGDALRQVLTQARDAELPIMVFAGNRGCLQIHTGPVRRLVDVRGWFNVLDGGFDLHLRDQDAASIWVVRKPTDDGPVHSVEAFDARGDSIVWFFGARKPGKPELAAWAELVAGL
jgi:putative hemin transport protein